MPPYTGIPYGIAPAWCFPVFEYGMYILLLICLVHAAKRGSKGVIYILGGLAFGLLLEYIEVITHSYTYSSFMIMFGKSPMHIPLCIGVGWGIIMYTARLFTDALKLSLWVCVALDTLLALNIDLSMDTVAYRLHMWHWNWSGTDLNPLTAQWFGIPYGNFVGWITVVFCYSAFSRLFEKKIMRSRETLVKYVLVALLALLCSQVVLYTTETFIHPFLAKTIGMRSVHRFAGYTIILLVTVIVGLRKRQYPVTAMPSITWIVPGWFHLFFISCLFVLGFYTENTLLTVIALLNLLLGMGIHMLPFRKKRMSR